MGAGRLHRVVACHGTQDVAVVCLPDDGREVVTVSAHDLQDASKLRFQYQQALICHALIPDYPLAIGALGFYAVPDHVDEPLAARQTISDMFVVPVWFGGVHQPLDGTP